MFEKISMKRNISSNGQDAGQTEGQGRNMAGKKEKARPISQALNDMMQESKKQKAGINKSGQNKNDYK